MASERWKNLSPRTRRLIMAAAAGDVSLKAAAIIDLWRRPAAEIRGSKRVWIPVVAIVNSAGLLPLCYFAFGRRRPGPGA